MPTTSSNYRVVQRKSCEVHTEGVITYFQRSKTKSLRGVDYLCKYPIYSQFENREYLERCVMNVVEEGRYKGNLMYTHFHQMNDIPPDYEILPKESDGRFLISVPYGGYPILAGEFDKLLITFKEV